MLITNLKKSFIKEIVTISLTLIFIWTPNTVFAVSGDGLAAYPTNPDPNDPATQSWFIYNLDRGVTKEDSLTIKNSSDKKQTLKIYAVDATTNNMGGFALETETDSRDGIGKWIHLEEGTVTLEAQEQKNLKFSINIPQNATTGEISGGIMVEKVEPAEEAKSESGFIINTRIGIRVYETVPGEIVQKVSFGKTSLEYDKKEKIYTLSVEINNESNVSIEPKINIGIKDTLFNVQNSSLEQKPLIPREGQVKATFTFKKPRVGKFEIVPMLTYNKADGTQETITNSQKISFWALPWDEIIIVTLLIIANILFLIILKILSKKDKKYYKIYKVKRGDDLGSIANKVGTNWKSIAKLNKIKPPYKLETGSIITVFDKKDMLEQLYLENEKISKSIQGAKNPKIQPKKKTFWTRISEILWLRKDILVLIALGSFIVVTAYMLYVNLFMKKNNISLEYIQKDSEIETQVNAEKEETGIRQDTTIKTLEETQKETEPVLKQPITTEERSAITIDALNGSGVKGASNKIAEAIKNLGYMNINSGNADRFNYTETLIYCATDIDERICEEIQATVKTVYPNAALSVDNKLKSKSVRIIIGR
jgi:LysM repeat protein